MMKCAKWLQYVMMTACLFMASLILIGCSGNISDTQSSTKEGISIGEQQEKETTTEVSAGLSDTGDTQAASMQSPDEEKTIDTSTTGGELSEKEIKEISEETGVTGESDASAVEHVQRKPVKRSKKSKTDSVEEGVVEDGDKAAGGVTSGESALADTTANAIESNAANASDRNVDDTAVNTEDQAYYFLSSQKYSYAELEEDIERLKKNFPGKLRVSSLGTTLDERKLYDIQIGNEKAQKHILIIGDMHAREYISGQLVTRQLGDLLRRANTDGTYDDIQIAVMLDEVEIHFVPMDNPDGVSISQFGLAGLQTQKAINRVEEIASLDGQQAEGEYLVQWKANANGVDINRNFDAKWEEYQNVSHASSDHYKGTAPGSEIEASALIDLTQEYLFDSTVSYHTMGQVIYWNFDQTGELKAMGEDLAAAVKQLTGYTIDGNFQALDAAGYKDWAVSKMNIPSLTIEVGYGGNPVDPAQFEEIWLQNQDVVPLLLEKVYKGEIHQTQN